MKVDICKNVEFFWHAQHTFRQRKGEKMNNKERFLELCSKVKRDGMSDLLQWLEGSDFFYCPASARFHGAHPGGLLEHSLNVYDELTRLAGAYKEIELSEETAVIVSLFHDLCKVNLYVTEKRNRKNAQGSWESYDAYAYNEKLHYGGHGSKSVFILQNYIKLSTEEAVAINCHMGSWDGNKDVGAAFEQFPVAWMLHVADEAACYIKERSDR